MSIKKYLFAAFLGLGICAGNADVWGSQEQTCEPIIPEDLRTAQSGDSQECVNVIRDYLSIVENHKNGNVLAFQCNVTVNGEQKNKAVIVLKNGPYDDPPHSEVCYYYIPFQEIVNCFIGNNNFIKAYANMAKGFWPEDTKLNESKLNVVDECAEFCNSVPDVIEQQDFLEFFKNFTRNEKLSCGGQNVQSLGFWKCACHTEVQFMCLKQLCQQKGGSITIQTHNGPITLSNVHDVKCVYSMYEPCGSCRVLNLFQENEFKFRYFAIDRNMPGNSQQSYEISPYLTWKNAQIDNNTILRGRNSPIKVRKLNETNWTAFN